MHPNNPASQHRQPPGRVKITCPTCGVIHRIAATNTGVTTRFELRFECLICRRHVDAAATANNLAAAVDAGAHLLADPPDTVAGLIET